MARGDGVTIAIVDTGVDCDHEDLFGRCVAGYDFVNRDDDPDDDNRHGTIEAGVAAAATDNGVGIAGVAWGARIMPLKAMDALGQGMLSDIAEALVWAVDNGARVINLSLGVRTAESVLEAAVTYAHDRGAVVVAAAGLAALLIAQDPSRTPDQVADIIARTAVDLGPPGRDDAFGHGRVDAAAAVVLDAARFAGFGRSAEVIWSFGHCVR